MTMRVCVISHALVHDVFHGRWRLLAERYPAGVDLVVPANWESTWFGSLTTWEATPVEEGRFCVLPMPVTDRRRWGRYLVRGLGSLLERRQPDVIMVYAEEFSLVLQQAMALRRWRCPHARLGFFTWNNLGVIAGRKRLLKRLVWRWVRRNTDFAIAGNSEAAHLLGAAGYRNPVAVQTEIGVDTVVFSPDADRRRAKRSALGLDRFVVGFCGRLTAAKGVQDLLHALERLGAPWQLLAVGDGDLRPDLEAEVREKGWSAVFTGQIDPSAIPDHLRAMDCMVLPSRTTPSWKEQFGLVLAQAMACGVPVIGSDSGAIPEVIGSAGRLFHEGDHAALAVLLGDLAVDPDACRQLSAAGRDRALTRFGIEALAGETWELLRRFGSHPTASA